MKALTSTQDQFFSNLLRAIMQLSKRTITKKEERLVTRNFSPEKKHRRVITSTNSDFHWHVRILIGHFCTFNAAPEPAKDRSRGNAITKVMNSGNFSQIPHRPRWADFHEVSRKSRHTYDQELCAPV